MITLVRLLSIVTLYLLLLSNSPAAETIPARVMGVVDGDTLRVSRKEGGTVRVRLYGIDCPEKGQRYGKEARRLTLKLTYGRLIRNSPWTGGQEVSYGEAYSLLAYMN